MGDILRIYSGGAQVNLYDSTNGVLHLGYTSEDILIESESLLVPLSSGNQVQVEDMISFEATILETDETQIDNLIARKGYLQEVYIVGIDSAFKIRDVFIRIKEIRTLKAGEAHKVTIYGRRIKEAVSAAADLPETNYCQFIQNILGAFGNCNVDGGSGIATGWSNNGGTSLSIDTSHLGGGYGNEQRLTLSDSGDSFRCRVRFAIGAHPIKLTASAYVDNRKAGTSYYDFGFRTITEGLAVTSNVDSKTLDNGENERISKTLLVTPTAALYVDVSFVGSDSGTAELGFDNVQLEIGSLTNYVENA